MSTSPPAWLNSQLEGPPPAQDDAHEFARLWQGFMTARMTLALVLLVLQGTLYATNTSHSKTLIVISLAYFGIALASRLFIRPRPLSSTFNRAWIALIGVDVLAFAAMQWIQGATINYTPLFALPILLASVLGSLRLALGTAAGVTVLLLSGTLWAYWDSPIDPTSTFIQSALSGVGYFAIAVLANQLASRLVTERLKAQQNQLAADVQRQVNALVIESLPDGVLIVDDAGYVRAANPAGRQLLGSQRALQSAVFDLKEEEGWRPLLNLTRLCAGSGRNQELDVSIHHDGMGPRRLRARVNLTAPQGQAQESLFVLFLQDLRELEARMRTEKLASMGRMSTAVAHEIRNPLAAISQANALLAEDLQDPRQTRLTSMVSQNAKRLERIVDDILNVARVQPKATLEDLAPLQLSDAVNRTLRDWSSQNGDGRTVSYQLPSADCIVLFDADHLRRILFNLLDNARRYAGQTQDSIQVFCSADTVQASVSVWSDGAPMEQSVERHLFEPFFSSESRSSGLGLFICRELCERHGATLIYQRSLRKGIGEAKEGNEFVITMVRTHLDGNDDNLVIPWQTTLY